MRISRSHSRAAVLLTLLLLLAPVAVTAATYTPQSTTGSDVRFSGDGLNASGGGDAGNTSAGESVVGANATDAPLDHRNLTMVTTQGTETGVGGGAYAVDPASGEVVWASTDWGRVFDIDPLSNSTVLLAAQSPDAEGWKWHAVRFNWRTGEVYETVAIPDNTHDVDYLGDHRYAVAEKGYSAKSHKKIYDRWEAFNRERGWVNESRETTFPRAYIVNASSGEITWQYHFADHYRREGNGSTKFRDWTHLNDIDVVDNGSSVLLSPRNFDRVVLVNKSTKETEWTLGEEENYDYLYAQHNPQLLDTDPATVLVADSHNDRVVEYVRVDGAWVETWSYEGKLKWPRDADRLPNGNTLVVDSNGDRILEVTPDKEVVWEMDVRAQQLGRKPYDIERVRLGDEPDGPSMHEVLSASKLSPEARNVSLPADANATGNATGGAADATPNATGDGVAADDLGMLTATVRPFRHAYVEYFTLAAWVLPLWVGTLEFTLLNLAAVVLVGWVGAEGLLWWRRRD